MIVFCFDDDRKFPLVSSLTTVGKDVRLEIVTEATQRSLRIVTTCEDTSDGESDIVVAFPLNALSGAMARIELEMSGSTRGLQVYIEGSDGDGVGLVWKLSKQNRTTGRRVLTCLVSAPEDRWDQHGADHRVAVAPPLTFHRLRLTVSNAEDVDVVLHELRLTGEVRTVPAGLSDA